MRNAGRRAGLAMAVSLWLVAGAQAQPAGSAEVVLARAPVDVIARGQTAPRPLAKGARLSEGDRVRTGRAGAAEIRLGDGSLVRLGELSELEIDKLDVDGTGAPTTSRFNLAAGQARAWVARQVIAKVATGQGRFAVQTPTAVAAVRQTDFAVLHDGSVTLTPPPGPGVSRVLTFAGGVEIASISPGRASVLCTRNRQSEVARTGDPTPCQVIPLRDRHAVLRVLGFECCGVEPRNLDRVAVDGVGAALDRSVGGQLFGAGPPTQAGRPTPGSSDAGTAEVIVTIE